MDYENVPKARRSRSRRAPVEQAPSQGDSERTCVPARSWGLVSILVRRCDRASATGFCLSAETFRVWLHSRPAWSSDVLCRTSANVLEGRRLGTWSSPAVGWVYRVGMTSLPSSDYSIMVSGKQAFFQVLPRSGRHFPLCDCRGGFKSFQSASTAAANVSTVPSFTITDPPERSFAKEASGQRGGGALPLAGADCARQGAIPALLLTR